MSRAVAALAAVFFVACAAAQDAPPGDAVAKFEAPAKDGVPGGWFANAERGGVALDTDAPHMGGRSVRIERSAASQGKYSTILLPIPVQFRGRVVRLRAFLRGSAIVGQGLLVMRQEGGDGSEVAEERADVAVAGDADWREASIQQKLSPDAANVIVGAALVGSGKLWIAGVEVRVDGRPISEAPAIDAALRADREFDGGSRVAAFAPDANQTANLALLGKVWGFLKYEHPSVASGAKHWDYELFRVLPEIVAAPDRAGAAAAMARWTRSLGAAPACSPCVDAAPPGDVHLREPVGWLSDESLLGSELSALLLDIHRNRSVGRRQFYVSAAAVGNPSFDHELPYPDASPLDPGFRLLAAFRFWNMVEYWHPYRDVSGVDWDAALGRALPKLLAAPDRNAYERELIAFIARARDGHASPWGSMASRPPSGACRVPANIRFLDRRAIVASVFSDLGDVQPLLPGDEIVAVDGVPVADMARAWEPYYVASNESARLRDMSAQITRGACGTATVEIERGGARRRLSLGRAQFGDQSFSNTHDRPGPDLQRLGHGIAYLKLPSVKREDVAGLIREIEDSRGLIVDIRNYPEYVVWDLVGRLIKTPTPFFATTHPDFSTPGRFVWSPTASVQPRGAGFQGRVVVLVDEISQSRAEFTAMALRAVQGAKVVGSQTAGADGDFSAIVLPGNFKTGLSGNGIFWPDRRPTQRVGIVPDIEAKPTAAGIAAGRDEVLESGIRAVVGDELTQEEVRRMARRGR